ncbi:hypothetical protein FHT77_000983 [Rhizobium sp. BK181]|uniref:hypothetical protein n=1 Tax=Rhizobium sp. BK181 TaxID=2587072 RepID=UPI00161B8E12|nr:hypothetical protein [Rhizobium sp. BK181]MBB3315141.1 hypothetical protein [Rhizobium sp. BK181]
MNDQVFLVLLSLGSTLAGGALYGVAMCTIDRIAKVYRRRAERRRLDTLRVDSTWDRAPWRDF